MKKILVLIVAIAILATAFAAYSLTTTAGAVGATNLITGDSSTFEGASVPATWTAFGGGALSLSTTVFHSGAKALTMTGRAANTWHTPILNIYSAVKAAGAGTYYISFWVNSGTAGTGRLLIRTASNGQYSFVGSSVNYYANSSTVTSPANTWVQYSTTVSISSGDLDLASGTMNLCIDTLNSDVVSFDDVQLYKIPSDAIMNGTFESPLDLTGWTYFNNAAVVLTKSTDVHSGTGALKFTRPSTYASAQTDVSAILKANLAGYYTVSYWAKLDSTATGVEPIQTFFSSSANNHFQIGAAVNINKDAWTNVTATVQIKDVDATWPTIGALTAAGVSTGLRFQGGGASPTTTAFIIDDVTVSYSATAPATATPTQAPTATPTLAPGVTAAPTGTPTAAPARTVGPDGNIFFAGDMESATVATDWKEIAAATLAADTAIKHGGAQSLKESGRTGTWFSPYFNIYDVIKANGPGNYTIKMWVYLDGLTADKDVQTMLRGTAAEAPITNPDSLIKKAADGVNYYVYLGATKVSNKTWTEITQTIKVTALDLEQAAGVGTFRLCLDQIPANVVLYMDDVQIIDPSKVTKAPTTQAKVAYKFTAPTGYTVATNWIRLTPVLSDILANGKVSVLVKNTGTSAVDLYVSVRNDDTTWSLMSKSDTVTLNPGDYKTIVAPNVTVTAGAKDPIPLLEIKGMKAGDSLVIGGLSTANVTKFSTGADSTAFIVAQIDPTGVFPASAIEKTGDPAMLGYAVAAISGLGALVVGKKRFKR